MLLLLQSYVTYQQFPRGGGETVAAVAYDEPQDDDDILMAWFVYMARYYAKPD